MGWVLTACSVQAAIPLHQTPAELPIALMAKPMAPEAKVTPYRDELRLLPAAHNRDGSPAWMIQDPVTNRFYRIDWLDFEILSRWHFQECKLIVDSVNAETTLEIDASDVVGLASFLQRHQLLQVQSPQDINRLIGDNQARRQGWLTWLVHHYLFFRIPLIRPQNALARVMPFLRWIYSPFTAIGVLAASLVGLVLVSHQWDVFSATLVDQLTFSGALGFAFALVISKTLHEFGHALTATRHGVRVAHMGIALLVMFPLPYTDTSESWKLGQANRRLHIASAGIVAELALAGFATLAWALTPDGSLRSALFFLATTSWLLTLAVNLSPFMRFDGYFILSDWLDFPNLHERSSALARVWLRRSLLGFDDPWPEEFPRSNLVALITFAAITWVYRLFVFIGIAWLVYYYFFKVLGIVLFAIEILWFVWLPIGRELAMWFDRRSDIKNNRLLLIAVCLGGFLTLGMVPWQSSIRGTAWLHALRQTQIHSPIPGKLVAATPAGPVRKGDRLFQLHSPDIALDAARSQGLSDARAQELRGLMGVEDGEAQRAELQFQREKFNAEVKLFKDELSRLDITAPFNGMLLDIDDGLAQNGWIHPKQALAVLLDPTSWIVDVLVPEEEVDRIRLGDHVEVFVLRSQLEKMSGTVQAIDAARLSNLPHLMLDAQTGGNISTLPGDKRSPIAALYKVRVTLNSQPDSTQMATGHAIIQTQAKAWLPTHLTRIWAVLVRESGF